MKKVLVIALLLLSLILCFASCKKDKHKETETEDTTTPENTDKTEQEDDKKDINANPGTTGCTHSWNVVVTPPTCTESGYETWTCTLCKEVAFRNETAPGHTTTDVFMMDDDYHWQVCTVCGDDVYDQTHTLGPDGICMVCKLPVTVTPGIVYEISEDGTYAKVIGYEGAVTRVRVANEYNGLPVKEISKYAFEKFEGIYLPPVEVSPAPGSSTTPGSTPANTGSDVQIECIVLPDSVTVIDDYAFKGCHDLTSVIFSDNLTSIGIGAFSGCINLTSVVMPNSVTSVGNYAFDNCASLTNLVLSNRLSEIGTTTFADCISLKSVVIPDSVTTLRSYAFSGCSSLESVILGENVRSVEAWSFIDCTSLTYIRFPDNIESVGEDAFLRSTSLHYNEYESCYYLGNEENPYLVLVSVVDKNITSCNIHESAQAICANAFADCSSLTEITIPSGVEIISVSAFARCTSLTSVHLNDGLRTISRSAFQGCTSLESIVIPEGVATIERYAFYGCSSLTSVTMPGTVNWIGLAAFDECPNIYTEYEFGKYLRVGDNPYAILIGVTDSTKSTYTIHASTKIIGGGAFSGCSRLTAITIPSSVEHINEWAFEGTGLTSVVIPDNVTSLGVCAFYNCLGLSYVSLGGIGYISGSTFYNCPSLTSVVIPTSVMFIRSEAFANCNSLSHIYYKGSEAEWAAINIEGNESALGRVTLHFNYAP